MPLSHGRPLRIQHSVPVCDLVWSSAVFAKHDSPTVVVPRLTVVVPNRQHNARRFELLWSDIKTDGFVEDRIDGVLLTRCLFSFDGFLVLD